jgi:hypothetical protein
MTVIMSHFIVTNFGLECAINMNKRIRELANQLSPVAKIGNWGRVEWSINVYPQLGDEMYAAIDLEKFAELIVRECADICNEIYFDRYPAAEEFERSEEGDAIKKHFGLKND